MATMTNERLMVPFFRPSISEAEIAEVVQCLRSGWLTTGPRTREFERGLAQFVGAKHAVALNSCTAALHLAVEALGLRSGQGVLVPTMTFAATAEVVRYQGAVPILVDCDPQTLLMDLEDAARKADQAGRGAFSLGEPLEVVGVIPVHVGGLMADMARLRDFAVERRLWIVEDAAHALPAAVPSDRHASGWQRCGEGTADVTCFSFYANKTITTGEGGMAVTDREELAERMRQMSLHGLSHDAWNRFRANGNWDYRIVAPGYKYNLTDIAASIGLHQLGRAEALRLERQAIAEYYRAELADVAQIELPPVPPDRLHSWHLFPIRLRLDQLSVDRDTFLEALRDRDVSCSVHWRPLHLHPYYRETCGWRAAQLPAATEVWPRLVSLPLFPGMLEAERKHVVTAIRQLCQRYGSDHAATRVKPR